MGKVQDFFLGAATGPMAGDGSRLSPSQEKSVKAAGKSPNVESCNSHSPKPSPASSIVPSRDGSPSNIPQPAACLQSGNGDLQRKKLYKLNSSVNGPILAAATLGAVFPTTESPRLSMESFHTASETSENNTVTAVPELQFELPWQRYEIPAELAILQDDIPAEILSIVQESLDEYRAVRESILYSPDLVTPEATQDPLNTSEPVIMESSAMASARLTPSVRNSITKYVASNQSSTSVKSDGQSSAHQTAPPILLKDTAIKVYQDPALGCNSSPASTNIESRLQESKLETRRTRRGFFRLVSTRRSNRGTSPTSHELLPSVSECTGCFDEIPDSKAVQLPCHHKYCSPCFAQLVSTSIQHEMNFPPKCCLTEIPRQLTRDNLPTLVRAKFDQKVLEYAIPIGNRYYCVSSTCGKWIDTRHARRKKSSMKCPSCATNLCTMCRGPQHSSKQECPQDFGLNKTLEQAERAGWRRCYHCKRMVERRVGCSHITCVCSAEFWWVLPNGQIIQKIITVFSYTCGEKWRTCGCTEDDLARRDRVVKARLAQYEADQEAEEEEVRAAAEAVEAAENQIREEREAEEARAAEEAVELERIEIRCVQQIVAYFEYLYEALERLCQQQLSAIKKRHDKDSISIKRTRDELESPEEIAKREAYTQNEREKISASTDHDIKSLQHRHASMMMEAIRRYRKDQDDLCAHALESTDPDVELTSAESLQELLSAQNLERDTLKAQQVREIQERKARGEAMLQQFDSSTSTEIMRLEETKKIKRAEEELRNVVFVDHKWTEQIVEERYEMLAQDRRRMIRNVIEAPAVPKGKEVVRPG